MSTPSNGTSGAASQPTAGTGSASARRAVFTCSRLSDAAGVIRDDFTIDDVPMLMCGLSSTMAASPPGDAFGWRRHLELMLDGIGAH